MNAANMSPKILGDKHVFHPRNLQTSRGGGLSAAIGRWHKRKRITVAIGIN